MAYPSAQDLAAFMVAEKLIDEAPSDLSEFADELDAAIVDFEVATKWSPFLSAGVVETRAFNATSPGPVQVLPVAVVSATFVTVNNLLSSSVGWELDAGNREGTFEAIRFAYGGLSFGDRFEVTGIFGRVTDLPSNVRRAIIKRAARALSAGSTSTSTIEAGTVKKETQGPLTIEYAVDSTKDTIGTKRDAYDEAWTETVARYKKQRLV